MAGIDDNPMTGGLPSVFPRPGMEIKQHLFTSVQESDIPIEQEHDVFSLPKQYTPYK